jgi:hypothetical protein
MESLGPWRYVADRAATIGAYESAPLYDCGCIWCRNFALGQMSVFPPAFLALLDRLGIDPLKPAEVFEAGGLYVGWYHFVGQIEAGVSGDRTFEMAPEFSVFMRPTRGEPRSINAEKLVLLEFHTNNVPWLLDEPDAG